MSYDENILMPVGKLTNLQVKMKNKTCLLECFVSSGKGPGLIVRQWLAAFKFSPLQLNNDKDEIVNLNINQVKNLKIENIVKMLSNKYE